MQHPSSLFFTSAQSAPGRAAWAAFAYLLGAVLGLAGSCAALVVAAQVFASPNGALQALPTVSPVALFSLLATALLTGIVLAAICSAHCLEAARSFRTHAADKRAAGVSVLSENFLQGITARFTNAATAQQACSVVLVSIDDFDALLQTHGRNAADAALEAVAGALHSGVRASDVVGRVGYDGFAVVLAVEESDVALRASERLHTAIRDIAIPLTNNGTLHLNVSLGVAVRGMEEAMETAFERAHEALQQALRDEIRKVKLAAHVQP